MIRFNNNDDSFVAEVDEISTDENNLESLQIIVDADTYDKIDTSQIFGLEPENRSEILGGEFEEGKPFRIDLILSPEGETILSGIDLESFEELMISESDETGSKLQQTSSWLATAVSQEMDLPEHMASKGVVRFGYNTRWSPLAGVSEVNLSDVLIDFLANENISYQKEAGKEVYEIVVRFPNVEWKATIHVFDERGHIMVLSHLPFKIPMDSMASMSEFVTRANYGLVNGNFALDVDSGDMHFKMTGHFYDDAHFSKYMNLLIRESSEAIGKYVLGMKHVLENTSSVAEAIRITESQ